MQHVLITGASGYIGRRLKHRLLEDSDVTLRLFVRNIRHIHPDVQRRVEIVEGDTFDTEALTKALEGIDVAYYLIHSMAAGEGYRERDLTSARNFRDAAIAQGVGTIIYLGGLGEKHSASEHLLSRIETGETLSAEPDKIRCLWFRAGVIIGSGSASFEIIRNLVQKLPIMITPSWVETRAQPIGVDDIIAYLDAGRNLEGDQSLIIDVGAEAMSYREMMLGVARVMGLYRTLIPVPILSPGVSSYWLGLFTPVPVAIARALVEGLRSEVLRTNDLADTLFKHRPESFENSVRRALEEIEQDQVLSRWSDSGGDIWERDHKHDIADALFVERHELNARNLPKSKLFEAFAGIGGKNGWFTYSLLWSLRGILDKMLGGVGLNRGRRANRSLRVGDSVDFWKVVDLVPDERLLLYAQMKLPGRGWLEFRITEEGTLQQSAYFYPNGVLGRLYWYAMWPLHKLIFKDMARTIIYRAASI